MVIHRFGLVLVLRYSIENRSITVVILLLIEKCFIIINIRYSKPFSNINPKRSKQFSLGLRYGIDFSLRSQIGTEENSYLFWSFDIESTDKMHTWIFFFYDVSLFQFLLVQTQTSARF